MYFKKIWYLNKWIGVEGENFCVVLWVIFLFIYVLDMELMLDYDNDGSNEL